MTRKSDQEMKEEEQREKAKDRRAVADQIAKALGDRIEAFRKQIKDEEGNVLSQEELAHLAGVDRSGLSSLETGKSCSRPDTLVRLAGVLQVPIEQLIEGLEWIPDGTGRGELRIKVPKGPADDKTSVEPERSG
jgi:transcriptional regulator with XRE-family HTH domain